MKIAGAIITDEGGLTSHGGVRATQTPYRWNAEPTNLRDDDGWRWTTEDSETNPMKWHK